LPQLSFYIFGYAFPGHRRGCPLVFLIAFLLAITMAVVVLLCSWLPLFGHHYGPLLVFLVMLFMAIIVVILILLSSWLHSSWPLSWVWLSSYVPNCFFLAIVVVILMFS
jgi:hypothetical protein